MLSCVCYKSQGLINLTRDPFFIQKRCNYSQGLTFHRRDTRGDVSNTSSSGRLSMKVRSACGMLGGDTKAVSMAAVRTWPRFLSWGYGGFFSACERIKFTVIAFYASFIVEVSRRDCADSP